MLPLLPLTREGEQRETIEEMISSLQAVGKDDLLPVGLALAALVFKADADKHWLRERYRHMYDLLEDSWFYQEIMQKGMQQGMNEGFLKGLRQALTHFVEKRFPELTTLAQQRSLLITNAEALQDVSDKLLTAQTADEARKLLLDVHVND